MVEVENVALSFMASVFLTFSYSTWYTLVNTITFWNPISILFVAFSLNTKQKALPIQVDHIFPILVQIVFQRKELYRPA